MRRHENYPYQCHLCMKLFETDEQRKKHSDAHDSTLKEKSVGATKKGVTVLRELECDYCSKCFVNENQLRQHRINIHSRK